MHDIKVLISNLDRLTEDLLCKELWNRWNPLLKHLLSPLSFQPVYVYTHINKHHSHAFKRILHFYFQYFSMWLFFLLLCPFQASIWCCLPWARFMFCSICVRLRSHHFLHTIIKEFRALFSPCSVLIAVVPFHFFHRLFSNLFLLYQFCYYAPCGSCNPCLPLGVCFNPSLLVCTK